MTAAPPSERLQTLAVVLCWGLCAFDVVLGGAAALAPDLYLGLFHPGLDEPQVELVRRTGMIWLAYAVVAGRAATARPADRARWYLVLAVVRFIDIPADVVYAATMTGASLWSVLLVAAAPPLNLALGGTLYYVSRRLRAVSD